MGWAQAATTAAGIMGEQYGAYQQMQESNDQAKKLISDSERQVGKMKEENVKFSSEQESMYLKSGVILEGSPLLVLEETRRKGLQERGDVRENARQQALNLMKQGREKFLGSLAFGGTSGKGGQFMSQANNAGGGG